jgi:hypothetical protein
MGLFLYRQCGWVSIMIWESQRQSPKQRNAKMTSQQAFELAMAICQNEKKDMSEIDDSQIGYYLVDRDIEETAENIAMIRNA